MAYLKHDYGVKDLSPDRVDPEEYELGINSRSFGEDHPITPRLRKLPPWVQYIWDNATITPFGRLKSSSISYFNVSQYHTGDEKTEDSGFAAAQSVLAQSLYVKKTINRDDILDISDIDVVSFMKRQMRDVAKLYIARVILGIETNVSSEAFRSVTDDSMPINVSDLSEVVFTGSETLFTSAKGYKDIKTSIEAINKDEVILTLGVKDVVIAPVVKPMIFDVSNYYLGFPKGIDGDIFEDFDIDTNTKKVLYEIKGCGLFGVHDEAFLVRDLGEPDR